MSTLRQSLITAVKADEQVGATQAGVHYLVAPQGATFPRVVWQKRAGDPLYVFARSTPFQVDYLYQVQVYATNDCVASKSGPAVVELILASLGTTLNDKPLVITGATLAYLRQERDIPDSFEQREHGNVYSAGALYRIEVNPT